MTKNIKKQIMKNWMRIYGLYALSVIVMAAGMGLGLYMCLSTFMPGNPLRKIFYVVALAIIGYGFYLASVAEDASDILKKEIKKVRRG